MRKRPIQLSFKDEAQKLSNSSVIENFIISDSSKSSLNRSFDTPFTIDGMIFGICLKGKAKVRINFIEYEVEKNTIFTIFPNEIFELLEKSDDVFVETLMFSMDFLIGLPLPKDFNVIEIITNQSCLKVSEEDIQYLLNQHSFIVESFNRKRHCYTDEVIKSLLLALIAEIAAIYIEKGIIENYPKNNRGEEITTKFLKLLFEHHKQERSTAFYSDKLCISTKYLSGVLRKMTGKPLNSWIYEAIIISAKIYLTSSNLTVLQISEELNFPNPSFFGKFFKQHTKMTPLQYRNSGTK